MNLDELEEMRFKIENMPTFHQVEILRLLTKHRDNIVLNENSNGVFVNLTDLSLNILNELTNYIEYYNHQEKNINYFEDKQEEYKSTYFEKNIKETDVDNVTNEQTQPCLFK